MKKILYIIIGIFLQNIGCTSRKEETNLTIASIDGENISFTEIDNLIQPRLYEKLNEIYYYRQTALNELINETLLLKEAHRTGFHKDSLINKNVYQKVLKVNLDSFARAQKLEKGVLDPKNPFRLVDINSAEGKNIISQTIYDLFLSDFYKQLRSKANVEIFLKSPPSPRINFEGIKRQTSGNPDSDKVITIVTDIECGGCKYYSPLFDKLYQELNGEIKFEYINFSSSLSYPSLVAEFSVSKNKFDEFSRLIFSSPKPPSDTASIKELVAKIGLDISEFDREIINLEKYAKINKKLLIDNGILTTPTLLINHRIYYGNLEEADIIKYIYESNRL